MPDKISNDPMAEFVKINQEFISMVKSPLKAFEEQNRLLNEFINQITGPFKEFIEQLPTQLSDKIYKIAYYTKELQLESNQTLENLLIKSHSSKQFPQEDTFKNLSKYKKIDYVLAWLGCLATFFTLFSTSENAEINSKTTNITTNIQEQNNITVNVIEPSIDAEILELIIDARKELEELKEQECSATETTKELTEPTLTSD